jgi:rhomboid protease GluP
MAGLCSSPSPAVEAQPWELVEIFRSSNRKAVNEHALVLQARGLAHEIVPGGGGYHLLVPSAQAEIARAELFRYDEENVGWPPREEPPPVRSRGYVAAALYAVIASALYPMGEHGFLGRDFLAAGALDAARVRAGELWRPITALTLHADLAHLAGNLVFGSVFAILASHEIGAGLAWLAILVSGALANLVNAWLQQDGFVSIGASTASFAALGMLAAYEWVRRASLRLRPLRRFAPLFLAAALLGWLGMGGAKSDIIEDVASRGRTDVVAHVAGFLVGGLTGVILGVSRLPEALLQ